MNNFFEKLIVLDLSSVLAGPTVGQFFAELGARVVKIENSSTNGDVTRKWKMKGEEKSSYFNAANLGKESVAMNLKSEDSKNLIYKFVKKCDIIIVNFKPGDAEELGVDYDTLFKINPKIIYGEITGYGSENPRTGYDAIIQAESGFMYLNREPDSKPQKMPVALIDLMAAHQLKEGILTALLQKSVNNVGSKVSVSLIQAALTSLANQATAWLVSNYNPKPMGSGHPSIVPYGNIFETSDNQMIILAIGNDKEFQAFCEIIQISEISTLEEYKTNVKRVENRENLLKIFEENIKKFDSKYLISESHRNKIPAGIIHTIEQSLALPEAKSLLAYYENQLIGIKTIGFSISNSSPTLLKNAPAYGEHTEKFIKENM